MEYIGISKTKFNSSACLISSNHFYQDTQILLTERFNRKKCSGAWPELPLQIIDSQLVNNENYVGDKPRCD